jgi:hypothetical protein
LVCPQPFTTRHEVRLHVKIHTSSQTKYVNGLKIATQSDRPKIYNVRIDGQLRKCTVPACSHAISGMRMSEQDMDKYMLHHEYAGHLESLTPYPIPRATDDLDPEEVRELLTAMDKALEKDTSEDNENQGMSSLVDSDMSGNIEIRGLRLDRTSESLARSNGGIGNIITYENGLEYIRQGTVQSSLGNTNSGRTKSQGTHWIALL